MFSNENLGQIIVTVKFDEILFGGFFFSSGFWRKTEGSQAEVTEYKVSHITVYQINLRVKEMG